METSWYGCLLYPFRAWGLVRALAALLTSLTAAAFLILLADEQLEEVVVILGLPAFVPLFAVFVASIWGFLNGVMGAGLAGELRQVRWPGRVLDLDFVFRSLVSWLLPLATVSAPLAVIGFYYWLNCGDQLVDWIILAEMGVVGSGYWLLAVLTVCRSGRVRDANPWRVAQSVKRLGWRSLVVAVVAGLLLMSHGFLAFYTTSVLHDKLGLGLLLAAGCWLSWLYWATFVFRMVGIWCYHSELSEAC